MRGPSQKTMDEKENGLAAALTSNYLYLTRSILMEKYTGDRKRIG
jgi:hypothetical protein